MTDEEPIIMVTYKMADGSLIWGEFGFVTDTEYFEESDEPTHVSKETWVRTTIEPVTFNPDMTCPRCKGEGEITTLRYGVVVTCPECQGTGEQETA